MRCCILVAITTVLSCKTDLPASSPIEVEITPAADWPDTVTVGDTDTLHIRLAVKLSDLEVTGVRVLWESDDTTVLQLSPLSVTSNERRDSLMAQLQAVAVARARTAAVAVHVTLTQAGFIPRSMTKSVTILERWHSVSVGRFLSCALNENRHVYCWGSGLALGNPMIDSTRRPSRVLGGRRFISISAGSRHVCGLGTDLVPYCWGFNGYGQLGDQTQLSHRFPTPVTGGNLGSVVAGGDISCGTVQDDRTSQCWGDQQSGQLGQGPTYPICDHFSDFAVYCRKGLTLGGYIRIHGGTPEVRQQYCVFTDVFQYPDCPVAVRGLSAGERHACGVIVGVDAVLCWGSNSEGQVGGTAFGGAPMGYTCTPPCSPFATEASQDSSWISRRTPYGGERFQTVSAGGAHTCALTVAGKAYCWGDNSAGQLGNGAATGARTPTLAAPGFSFSAITTGGEHTCGIVAQTSRVLCWGGNFLGQLGNGRYEKSLVPVPLSGDLLFSGISAGFRGTCGVTIPTGAIYCWGRLFGEAMSDQSAVPIRLTEGF